jgi:integrase
MRVREDFTVYPRKLGSGKTVFYYQCYDEDGKRTNGHSTGETTRTAAVKKCNALMLAGKLLPSARKAVPTFAEFARGWWEWDTCPYLKKQRGRKDITRSYAKKCKGVVDSQLLPYFGKMRLDKITDVDIDAWLVGFADRGYKNSYANTVFGTLGLMLGEAVRRRIIPSNPAAAVEKLKNGGKQMELLTPDEVRRLFPLDWGRVWADDIAYVANKLAACTGMRIGEVLGLRGEYVFDDYICVCAQYGEFGYGPTKTKERRNIPLARVVRGELQRLMERNGRGYLFSDDGGETPVTRRNVYEDLMRALTVVGIDRAEARRRGITLHAWRHFFNTTLRMANVSDSKVQSVTGHKSMQMTDRYTHFDSKDFAEVRTVQEGLLIGVV